VSPHIEQEFSKKTSIDKNDVLKCIDEIIELSEKISMECTILEALALGCTRLFSESNDMEVQTCGYGIQHQSDKLTDSYLELYSRIVWLGWHKDKLSEESTSLQCIN
jgi:hypothetical protein